MTFKTREGDTYLTAYGAYVNGTMCAGSSGEVLEVLAPSDGKAFATIPRCTGADVGRAVKVARQAYQADSWAALTAAERGRMLLRLADLIRDYHEELAALEARDTGKPVSQARADAAAAARYFEFYGGGADKIGGETIPAADGFLAVTLREPHGVVGAVIPWNYPLQIFSRVAGAALAMGNALVIKPAEHACLSVLRLAELATEAGIPDGILNVVTGFGDEVGAALAHHPGIDFLTFTGSPQVGTLIQAAAARNHIGCTLELGGKSPQILFEDADLDQALPVVRNAIIQNGGQTCSAGSRVLVHQPIYDEVVERLRNKFRALVTGPHDKDLDIGPLINAAQARRVSAFCERAKSEGIPLIAEGSIAPDAPKDGFYTTAKIYGPVPPNSALAQEEVFGPVLAVIPFRDEAEAVHIANDTPYGLVAGVWTRDGARGLRVARQIRSGQVFINAYGAGGGVELPFGGVKKSGHGREKGFEALREFSVLKTLIINHG